MESQGFIRMHPYHISINYSLELLKWNQGLWIYHLVTVALH